jgi:glycerol kinase
LQAAESESTALGAAYLAGLHAGIWPSLEALRNLHREGKRFEPRLPPERREQLLAQWRKAVQAVVRYYSP